MVWQFYGVLILGIAVHETACCSQFLISMALDSPKQLKFPVYWACAISNVSSIIVTTMYWRVYNLAFPQTPEELNKWFAPNSIIGSTFSNVTMYALTIVILLRTLRMYQNDKKNWFRIYTIIMTVILTIGFVGSTATVYPVFIRGVDYLNAPLYRMYVLFTGVLLSFPLYIHVVIAAFNFLYLIYSARGFTLGQFLKDWILKQDGFRYVIMAGLSAFNIYCFFISLFFGQNDTTTLMFHVSYWFLPTSLMTFMENSYVTTKSVMNSKGSSQVQGLPSQVTSAGNQVASRTSSNNH